MAARRTSGGRIRQVTVVSLACLTVMVGVAGYGGPGSVVATATASVVTDHDGDGIDDSLEQRLAERFAPVVFFEPDETNYPVNVDWFLARARLQYHEDCTFDVDDPVGPSPLTTAANLIGPPWAQGPHCGTHDTGYAHPPHHLLTTTSGDPDGQVSAGASTTGFSDQQSFVLPDLADSQRVGSTDPRDWPTYFHAYPAADGGVVLQYWHLFAYNELGVAGIGDHGGDWDASIQVQLNNHLELTGVWFSRHGNDHPGDFMAVGSPDLHLNATHPMMTVDGGGHAAYSDPADFCAHRPVIAGVLAPATATWPTDPSDPLNPAKLHTISCSHDPDLVGGAVWRTWTGGDVRSSGGLTHPLPAVSAHGGLLNLGEYNPCTPTACNGSRQASSLNAGQLRPLNGFAFLAYSGRWGSLPHQDLPGRPGVPPRGPVFQGFEDRGEHQPSVYTSWYNQGSDRPAEDAPPYPWMRAPTSTLAAHGPSFSDGAGTVWLAGNTTIALAAQQNEIAAQFGQARLFCRVSPANGSPPHDFQPYTQPFSLPAPDGPYAVEYYAVDALNNTEPPQARSFSADTQPPAVSIRQPTATSYLHSATVTLDYSSSDAASGPASSSATLDGADTLGGHSLFNGLTLDLLTELPLGEHTFAVTATDNVGNQSNKTLRFSVIATAASIQQDVRRFVDSGAIGRHTANSLLAKLQAAESAVTSGRCGPAAHMYRAFEHEVDAQTDKAIAQPEASILIADAEFVATHCR